MLNTKELQAERKSQRDRMDTHEKLKQDTALLTEEKNQWVDKYQATEQQRLQLESEARDSGEQLREMAEKVFQLLEHLKLAELGKTRSMEALRKKEQETTALKKKNSHLLKESTREGKQRVKLELLLKERDEEARTWKKNHTALVHKLKEEAKLAARAQQQHQEAQQKVQTLNGRLGFLLNKLQTDEEARGVLREDTKKLEADLRNATESAGEVRDKLRTSEEERRQAQEELSRVTEELAASQIQVQALQKRSEERDAEEERARRRELAKLENDSHHEVERKLGNGRLRFYAEEKSGNVSIKAKCPRDRDYLDKSGYNAFLKRVWNHQKQHTKEHALVTKLAEMLGTGMVEQEERRLLETRLQEREGEMEALRHQMRQNDAFINIRIRGMTRASFNDILVH